MNKAKCPVCIDVIKKYGIKSYKKTYVNLFDKSIDDYPIEKLATAEVVYMNINYVNKTCKMKLNLR